MQCGQLAAPQLGSQAAAGSCPWQRALLVLLLLQGCVPQGCWRACAVPLPAAGQQGGGGVAAGEAQRTLHTAQQCNTPSQNCTAQLSVVASIIVTSARHLFMQ
jgi:hypothetical protein